MDNDMDNTNTDTTVDSDSTVEQAIVPEAYQEEGWAKKINSIDDLWKNHAEVQKLIGRKRIIPNTNDFPEEEVNNFYNELKPKDPSEYDLPEENREVWQNILHESGVSTHQAKILANKYQDLITKEQEKLFDQDEFNTLITKTFGSEGQKAIENGSKIIKSSLGEDDKKVIEDTFTNNQLTVLYKLLNKIDNMYGVNEGSVPEVKEQLSPVDKTDRRKELLKKMDELKRNPSHTTKQMQQMQDEYNSLLGE